MARQIIWKKIRGKYGPYAYLYESFRDATGVPRKRFIKYLGSNIPFGTKIAHVKQEKTPAFRKKGIKPWKHHKRKLQGRRPKWCMLPVNRKCRHPKCVRYACQYYQPIIKKRRRM